MFEEKMKELLNAEFDAIPTKEELEKMYTFSERHEENMEEIFEAEERKENKKVFYAALKKAAVIALAVIGCAFVSLKVVPTVYAYVETLLIENSEDRVIFKDKDNTEYDEVADLRFEPSYVPEGYEFVEEIENEFGNVIIKYKNAADELLKIGYSKANGMQISVDIDNTIEEAVVVNGNRYYTFSSYDDFTIIIWKCEGYLFDVSGKLDTEEMLNVAASVVPVKD